MIGDHPAGEANPQLTPVVIFIIPVIAPDHEADEAEDGDAASHEEYESPPPELLVGEPPLLPKEMEREHERRERRDGSSQNSRPDSRRRGWRKALAEDAA